MQSLREPLIFGIVRVERNAVLSMTKVQLGTISSSDIMPRPLRSANSAKRSRPHTDVRTTWAKMLPTPSTSHVPFERVYEPAEDSYLLLDTLSSGSEVAFLSHRFRALAKDAGHDSPSPLIVEVGTGSGIVLAFLTANARAIFGREDVLTLGTDVNGQACSASQKTVTQAIDEAKGCEVGQEGSLANDSTASPARYLDSLITDLCDPLRPGLVDVLVFNPPYVPTPSLPSLPRYDARVDHISSSASASTFEHDSQMLSLSYAGGVDGMETTDRLLGKLDKILDRYRGVAYVLLCAQNKPEDVKSRLRSGKHGWTVETVGRSGKTAGWEKLEIIRIWRKEAQTVDS